MAMEFLETERTQRGVITKPIYRLNTKSMRWSARLITTKEHGKPVTVSCRWPERLSRRWRCGKGGEEGGVGGVEVLRTENIGFHAPLTWQRWLEQQRGFCVGYATYSLIVNCSVVSHFFSLLSLSSVIIRLHGSSSPSSSILMHASSSSLVGHVFVCMCFLDPWFSFRPVITVMVDWA